MTGLLAEQPLLLLFAILALGSALGSLSVRGLALGPAGALFAALALSAYDERLELPQVVGYLGLSLFAYCIGITTGAAFFAALRSGLRPLLLVTAALLAGAGLAYGIGRMMGLDAGTTAGVFAGALTNTPALAAATDAVGGAPEPTVGYAVTYVYGVLGMLLATLLVLRRSEGHPTPEDRERPSPLANLTVRVTRRDLPTLGDLARMREHRVVFSRVRHQGQVAVAAEDLVLDPGDLVSLIGAEDVVLPFADWLGERSDEHLPLDRHALDMRRMTLSNRKLSGLTVAELRLSQRFGAVATRVRRADVDLLATDDLVVQTGDRIRVIARRERLGQVARYLGDSERAVADINPVGLSLGLALGLLAGQIELPAPGGGTFDLGVAAGPLLVGLLLGRLGRTGSLTWTVPYNAAASLQQLGVLVFLAYAGSRSGSDLAAAFASGAGLELLAAGFVVTSVVAAIVAVLAREGLGLAGPRIAGLLAGAQTQPAVLAFANERVADQRVNLGYALVFPAAMVVKILAAQVLAGL